MIDQKIVKPYLDILIDKGFIYKDTIKGSSDQVDEIMYSLIETGEYFIDVTPEPRRWIIRKSSDFLLNESVKTTNYWMRWFTGIVAGSAILTLLVGIATLCIQIKELRLKTDSLPRQATKPMMPILPLDTSFSAKDKASLGAPTLNKPDSANRRQ